MKKRYFYFFILIVGLITACRNEVNNPGKPALFEENPVTIKWNSKKGSSIDSFQANVQIHMQSFKKLIIYRSKQLGKEFLHGLIFRQIKNMISLLDQ